MDASELHASRPEYRKFTNYLEMKQTEKRGKFAEESAKKKAKKEQKRSWRYKKYLKSGIKKCLHRQSGR
eukprot:12066951-Ditylum_brightwellii.AAC.1